MPSKTQKKEKKEKQEKKETKKNRKTKLHSNTKPTKIGSAKLADKGYINKYKKVIEHDKKFNINVILNKNSKDIDKQIKRVLEDLKDYPKTKLEYYKEFDSLIPKIYIGVYSNKQISTLYKEYLKNKPLIREWYYNLLILLGYQYNVDYDYINKIITKDDDEIYKLLRKKKVFRKDRNFINVLITKCEFNNFILSKYKNKIKNYLDVGCGVCQKTLLTGKRLGLDVKNIYGLNIKDDPVFQYINTKQKRGGINYDIYDKNEAFPYSNNYFSLVSYDYVLHHVEDLKHILNETQRVLKPGGLLLVIEHDAITDFDKILIDMLHLYSYEDYDIKNTYSTGNYMSWIQFNYIITSHGFQLLSHEKAVPYYERTMNVVRKYYNVYKKL